MAQKKRWTIDEDNYVLSQVKEDSRNLTKTFRKCAEHLDRTPTAVATRQYNKISKPNLKSNAAFTLISNNYTAQNRKQFSPSHTKRTPRNVFSWLLDLLFK